MKSTLLLLSSLLFGCYAHAADNYTIYLVRHAEKLADSQDPNLTACGKQRAQQLATILSRTNITTIYSTSYQRTMQTAQPLAKLQHSAIKHYNPRYLEQLSVQIKRNRENTLIVGHSNTTPKLVELFTKQKVTPLTDKDYQYLYQIQFINNEVLLTVLQQPLVCLAY